jgi:3-oxoadipate enol-lactonase
MRRPSLAESVAAARDRRAAWRAGPDGTVEADDDPGDHPGTDLGDEVGAPDGLTTRPRPPSPAGVPEGRAVDLPHRGTTFVREVAGPPGAPTLLLLHGWTATAGLNWCRTYEPLAEHFRVVSIDHRGHGRGIRSRRRFRLEDCADDAVALADELGIDTFIPVGYSMGGPIAQLTWRRHRARVDGLVLSATSRNFRGRPIERAFFPVLMGLSAAARVTPGQWRSNVGRRVIGRRMDDDEFGRWARSEIAGNDPRVILEAGQAIGSFSSHEWIGEVDVPTAVVITELDSVVPPHRQHKLADSIDGATIHVVAGDHGAAVMSARAYVPQLVAACRSVARRAR